MDGVFEMQGKQVLVTLKTDKICWKDDNSQSMQEVCMSQVLTVHERWVHGWKSADEASFTVHYAERKTEHKLRKAEIVFVGEIEKCQSFAGYIRKCLEEFRRPRRLMVFINPNSGKRKAFKVYRKQATPLFNLCGIEAEVFVTSRPKEPTDILHANDLSHFDGIVTVGGDGLYSECLNGLITRTQTDAGIDFNRPECPLKSSQIPLGIIPAGSGNYVVQYLHGTKDVETAVLKIILGQCVGANAASVHQGQKLSAYSGLILGFGLFGDMMVDCDQYRWMGPSRYSVIPLGTMMKRRTIDVEVEYLPVHAEQRKRSKYHRQCSLPARQMTVTITTTIMRQISSPNPERPKSSNNGWEKIEGHVYGVDTYPVSLTKSDDKLVPYFGDKALTVTVTNKCSFSEHLAQLSKLQEHKADSYKFDFIRQFRTDRYRVKLKSVPVSTDEEGQEVLRKKYYINCDGEVILVQQPEFEVRLHEKVVLVFGECNG